MRQATQRVQTFISNLTLWKVQHAQKIRVPWCLEWTRGQFSMGIYSPPWNWCSCNSGPPKSVISALNWYHLCCSFTADIKVINYLQAIICSLFWKKWQPITARHALTPDWKVYNTTGWTRQLRDCMPGNSLPSGGFSRHYYQSWHQISLIVTSSNRVPYVASALIHA